ncbi:hypothetical protein SKAU_G00162440 [Synaphobranchus kaupii]|uniref:Uncharacterized protein n=1 Tax=Synaphobranchus kaupii TaxID=118154 RepID=A0A9Q1FIS4_SYNKA|nr:hypothetical protein SKAU_G00162440 [Synaphobranchus kaupii]
MTNSALSSAQWCGIGYSSMADSMRLITPLAMETGAGSVPSSSRTATPSACRSGDACVAMVSVPGSVMAGLSWSECAVTVFQLEA